MPDAAKPTAEERAQAKAQARLAMSLSLVAGTGEEIRALRQAAQARREALGIDRVDYHPDFCELVRECGAAGQFQAEIAATLGCSEMALWTWAQSYAEFMDAMDEASTLAKAFWERLGRKGMGAAAFNQSLWQTVMKAKWRREYSDQQPEPEKPRDPVAGKSEAELRAEIEAKYQQMAKRPWVGGKPQG